jgi:hypothetical protein
MTNINLPYHLIIPSIIAFIVIVILFIKRNKIYKNDKMKWFWISTTAFFILYFFIVSWATYSDISCQIILQKFDLNGDGFFSGNENTSEQKEAMNNLIHDTGRNFSFITGFIFSGIIALFVFIFGNTFSYIKRTHKMRLTSQ